MSAGPARTCSGSTVEKKRVTARLDVPLRAGHLFFLIVLCYLPIRTQPPVRFHAEMESALADGNLTDPFLPLELQTCKDSLEHHSGSTPQTS